MRTFLLVATIVLSMQSSFSLTSTSFPSGSVTTSAELEAIAECNATQLSEAEAIMTSNQRQKQCQTALNLSNGTMLQVTTISATDMCETASCKAALQELYNVLPDCRYNLWGLQHSAEKLLEFCGITPTNTTNPSLDTSGSMGWSVTADPPSFAPAGATEGPSTPSGTTESSSASSKSRSVVTSTTISAASVFLIAALLG